MKQFLQVVKVSQVVSGAEQGQQLFARTRTAVAIVGQALECILPRMGRSGFHHELFGIVRGLQAAAL